MFAAIFLAYFSWSSAEGVAAVVTGSEWWNVVRDSRGDGVHLCCDCGSARRGGNNLVEVNGEISIGGALVVKRILGEERADCVPSLCIW